jgi:hypothetical protein
LLHVINEHRGRKQVVHRNIEKPLNLTGMQIHGDDPVGAGGGQQVRHQFGADGHPGGDFFILAGVPEIGNHRGDPLGRRSLEGIDHQQQFHQVVVDGLTGGLDDKNIF